MKPGFRLSTLAVTGAGHQSAALALKPGLNVIAGASNTGKSYVLRAIDYMLGASTPPATDLPQSKGYTHCQLEIISYAEQTFTLSRALVGGGAQLFQTPMADVRGDTLSRKLGAKAAKGDSDTISEFLLGLCGLAGRELRRNEHGEKSILSFRDVAGLTLVDEEWIITQDSPLLPGEIVEETKEKAVFGLFLTGTDDSAIIAQERTKDRKARLRTELTVLQSLIDEREKKLKAFGFNGQIDQHRAKVEAAIKRVSSLVATQQAKIDELASKRDQAWNNIQENDNRRLFLGDQLKRLRLLRQHYDSDSKRLESALEAGAAFEQLPTGQCPVCGHQPDGKGDVETRLAEFNKSCQAEMLKIVALRSDLDASLKEMQAEHDSLVASIKDLGRLLAEANQDIENLLTPKLEDADAKLSDLLEIQNKVVAASEIAEEILTLRSRHSGVEQALDAKVKNPKLAAKVETGTAAKFCEMVGETLKAWKYPNLGTISFDSQRFDLAIGAQNRGSMGKGYRALTHAAMVISLMRYCRAENLPHSGLVVVDSPLNPFRGPDVSGADKVSQEVQNAFYEDLARDNSGDQVLVLENTEPPEALRQQMNYIHFSAAQQGRYGFFPPLTK